MRNQENLCGISESARIAVATLSPVGQELPSETSLRLLDFSYNDPYRRQADLLEDPILLEWDVRAERLDGNQRGVITNALRRVQTTRPDAKHMVGDIRASQLDDLMRMRGVGLIYGTILRDLFCDPFANELTKAKHDLNPLVRPGQHLRNRLTSFFR